jgi:tRNA threonylcarbamoyladenosine biosynthesis protein TsaE
VAQSVEATEAVAARLAARLVVGDVVTLAGALGAGKTTFVRGACRALGVAEAVTSPTFTIGHRYHGKVDVSHLDLYRFAGMSPAEWGDLEPYFDDAIVFVEWPQAGAGTLPPARAAVELTHVDPTTRQLRLDAAEAALLEDLAGAHPGLRHGD